MVVALALYRHQSIGEVIDSLDLALPDAQAPFVTKSAIAQAWQCLGAEPLRALFEISAKAWSEQDRKQYLFKGLSLFAMDGTTLKTADTPEHRAHFGEQVYASGRISSYPQVRGLTMAGVNRHFIIPAKANTKWDVAGDTPDDVIIEMRVSPQARKKSPDLPEIWRVWAITTIN